MRAREFVRENANAGGTTAGNVATLAQPLGTILSRTSLSKPAKYANSLNQKRKHNVSG